MIRRKIEDKLNGDFASALADIGVTSDTHAKKKVIIGGQYDHKTKRDGTMHHDGEMRENMIKNLKSKIIGIIVNQTQKDMQHQMVVYKVDI